MRRFVVTLLLVAATACNGDRNDQAVPTPAPATSATPAAAATPLASPLTTPKCEPGGRFTPASSEGPYFKAGSPEKRNLYADVGDGTKLTVSGYVLSTECAPQVKARVDFWQAD